MKPTPEKVVKTQPDAITLAASAIARYAIECGADAERLNEEQIAVYIDAHLGEKASSL